MFALLGIRMINLSLGELRLIAQIRNMSDYENKSKEDLIKALSEAKPEVKPKPERKPETKPKQTPKQTWKPETIPKQTPKPEQEPKIEIKVNKKKFKKLRKDFDKLRHKFSNKNEIREYRQAFYDAKKYKLSESEVDKTNKYLIELKKVLNLKNFVVILIASIMNTLMILIIIMILLMVINEEKLGVLEHYLKSLIEIITNQ